MLSRLGELSSGGIAADFSPAEIWKTTAEVSHTGRV